MIKHSKKCIILFILILYISIIYAEEQKIESIENKEYYIVIANRLLIRDLPDVKGKIISVVNKNEKLLLIEKTDKYTEASGVYGEWLNVKTPNNVIGFAFGGFLTEYVDYKLNKVPFNILGEWHRYFDPPNQSYYFYTDNICKVESIAGYEKPLLTQLCKYEYDGICNIEITYDNGHVHKMKVVNIDKRTTIKDITDTGFVFFFDEENLHTPIRNK